MAGILPPRRERRAIEPFAVVVLAAGASRRLGRPKALVARAGQPLVGYQIERAIEAGARWVGVTVGCQRERLLTAIRPLPVTVVPVPRWRRGMGESVAAAARHAPRGLRLVVLATDQWAVRSADLVQLARAARGITLAATYRGIAGIPVSFAASTVPTLRRLSGDQGARSRLRGAAHLSLPSAEPDLDTPADLQRLDTAWPRYRRCPR